MEQFIKRILKICKAPTVLLLILLALGCNSNDEIGNVRLDNDCLLASKNLYPDQATSTYLLPWAIGQTFLVSQGNCTNKSHRADLNQQFAYDFAMSLGTQIRAAREGIVIAVLEDFFDGTGVVGEENYISVQHNDGTVARYVHLTKGGALFDLGEDVEQGEIIALSGNSGNSSGPHLHFDVMNGNCGLQRIDCHSLATTFRNTSPHPEGLQDQVSHKAESI